MKRLVILAFAVAACQPAESATQSSTRSAGQPRAVDSALAEALLERADKSRIQGSATAPVWIVEVSDFQCQFCKMWHDSTYATIRREFIATGQVRMAYVHFPIQTHANAFPAAKAAMCAGLQDKFWPMHDEIFKSQNDWAPLQDASAKFESLAVKSGVAIPAWRECMGGSVMDRLIAADRQRGLAAGVNSTPYFFVGDEAIRGAAPAEAFRAAIQRARTKAAASKPR
jgi:protein-disulfide isomerase